MRRVAILGGGGMGTALAVLLARTVDSVGLWVRDPHRAEELARTRENSRHLKGIRLPERVEPTNDAAAALDQAELFIVAIPSAFLRETLLGLSGSVSAGVPALSVVKGIERGTFARPTRIIEESLGPRPTAVLSGPSHAEEFSRGLADLRRRRRGGSRVLPAGSATC